MEFALDKSSRVYI